MKANELRAKTIKELDDLLSKQRREQFALRIGKMSGELTQNHLLKQVKRTIARILTIREQKLREANNDS